jgi:hypothetical protein
MKKLFILTICFFALVTLNGQIVQERLPGAEEISNRRSPFNLEELKVRWKKVLQHQQEMPRRVFRL